MTPYRSNPPPKRTQVLRLSGPLPIAELLLVGAFFFGPLCWALACDSTLWAISLGGAGVLVVVLMVLCRHYAWVVVMPREERVRVVRLHGWSYSASTLPLGRSMSVDWFQVGAAPWLCIVAEDGRAARVLPGRSRSALDLVQTALDTSRPPL